MRDLEHLTLTIIMSPGLPDPHLEAMVREAQVVSRVKWTMISSGKSKDLTANTLKSNLLVAHRKLAKETLKELLEVMMKISLISAAIRVVLEMTK